MGINLKVLNQIQQIMQSSNCIECNCNPCVCKLLTIEGVKDCCKKGSCGVKKSTKTTACCGGKTNSKECCVNKGNTKCCGTQCTCSCDCCKNCCECCCTCCKDCTCKNCTCCNAQKKSWM